MQLLHVTLYTIMPSRYNTHSHFKSTCTTVGEDGDREGGQERTSRDGWNWQIGVGRVGVLEGGKGERKDGGGRQGYLTTERWRREAWLPDNGKMEEGGRAT